MHQNTLTLTVFSCRTKGETGDSLTQVINAKAAQLLTAARHDSTGDSIATDQHLDDDDDDDGVGDSEYWGGENSLEVTTTKNHRHPNEYCLRMV